jgi:hypothetical protein
MLARYVLAAAFFVFVAAAFIVVGEFTRHFLAGKDRADQLFGVVVAVVALGVALFFLGCGLRAIGL